MGEPRPELHFDTVAVWESWLEHPEADAVTLRLRRAGSSQPGITYAEALDAALCFGWIDGQRARGDGDHFKQNFSPRRAHSVWSQVNCDHAERLTAEGRMRPGGLAEIEKARADGRWDAAYRQKGAEAPADLRAALDAEPAAAEAWDGLNSQNRFAILFRIGNVKRADTRARKIAEYVAMLARGERLHP